MLDGLAAHSIELENSIEYQQPGRLPEGVEKPHKPTKDEKKKEEEETKEAEAHGDEKEQMEEVLPEQQGLIQATGLSLAQIKARCGEL